MKDPSCSCGRPDLLEEWKRNNEQEKAESIKKNIKTFEKAANKKRLKSVNN